MLRCQVGAETFRLCRNLVDGIVLVDNASISAAIKDVFNETRSILEPAGAVAVAGAKAYLKRHNMQVSSMAGSWSLIVWFWALWTAHALKHQVPWSRHTPYTKPWLKLHNSG